MASALKVTLLGDVAAKTEIGGTRNPAAFDAYLRASNAYRRFGPANLAAGGLNKEGLQSAVDAYTEAVRADPDYALAYAGRSLAFTDFARALVAGPGVSDYFNKGQSDARKAIALAPDLADSHLAMANFFAGSRAQGRTSGIRTCARARARRCKSIEGVRRIRRPDRPH